MNRRTFLGAAAASLVAAACSSAPKAVSTTAPATPSPTPGPPATKATVELVKGGSFSFTLRADKAPQTVARFAQKARAGFYDNLTFHRVEEWVVVTITEPVKGKRLEMVDEIKRALEVAEVIPFQYLIQHMGVSGEEFDMRKFDAAFSALEELCIFARQRGVDILLENIPNELSSAERLLQFEELTHLGMSYVFDTGHAHMNEGVAHAFNLLKDKIRSTHVHDNDGKSDSHLFPILSEGGTIDWRNTMQLLRSRGEQFPLLLELKERPEITSPLEAVKEIFDKLEAQRADESE